MIDIKNVVVIGANGTMGAGSGEVFAAGGCDVMFLARAADKAQEGLVGAQNMAKSVRIADRISVGTYDADLEKAVAKADLIFEALAEDIELKKTFFARVDKCRRPNSIVATVSSGLSIAEMARGRSDSFRRNFLGIHLFNPPHVIVGTEASRTPRPTPSWCLTLSVCWRRASAALPSSPMTSQRSAVTVSASRFSTRSPSSPKPMASPSSTI